MKYNFRKPLKCVEFIRVPPAKFEEPQLAIISRAIPFAKNEFEVGRRNVGDSLALMPAERHFLPRAAQFFAGFAVNGYPAANETSALFLSGSGDRSVVFCGDTCPPIPFAFDGRPRVFFC